MRIKVRLTGGSYTVSSCIALIFFFFFIACSMGLRHTFNFFPSPGWTKASLVLPFLCAAPLLPTPLLTVDRLGGIRNLLFVWALLAAFTLFAGYDVFAYGLGPLATRFSPAVIEKDIDGTKKTEEHYRAATDYYIDTPALPEGDYARLYITRQEFEAAPLHPRLHIVLRTSPFGMTVESYSFQGGLPPVPPPQKIADRQEDIAVALGISSLGIICILFPSIVPSRSRTPVSPVIGRLVGVMIFLFGFVLCLRCLWLYAI